MAGNQNIGSLLHKFFKGHSKINFDLFINALIIHYDIDVVSQPNLALFFQMIFEISEHNKNVYINEIILLTDFISIPHILIMLENGIYNAYLV